MKFAIVILATLALATAQIDIENIEPVDIFPQIPVYPEAGFHSGRIVGGDEAHPGQFPYQAGLALHMGDKQGWCGGSIISDEWILTAAHCTENADAVTVYIGAHNIKENEESTLKIHVGKENIIVHEKWSMLTLQNDISLIRLPQKLEFNDRVQPVNLPTQSQAKETFDGSAVIASGWGKDSDKSTSVSPVLRFVEVPVLAKWRCNVRFFGKIKDSHICISGSGGKSTCNGDSGGPLVLTEKDGSKTLLGATSFGIAFGCEIGWPGVFTRISSFLDWINAQTGIAIRS